MPSEANMTVRWALPIGDGAAVAAPTMGAAATVVSSSATDDSRMIRWRRRVGMATGVLHVRIRCVTSSGAGVDLSAHPDPPEPDTTTLGRTHYRPAKTHATGKCSCRRGGKREIFARTPDRTRHPRQTPRPIH